MTQPLAGRTVLVTRAPEDAATWVQAVEARGGRALTLPCLATEVIRDESTAMRLREAMSRADWIVFTSYRGVAAAAEVLSELPSGLRVAVVGPATAEAAERTFGRVNYVAAGGTGASLARGLAGLLALEASDDPGRVVIAAADRARHHLEGVLEPLGHDVARVDVYRTVPAAPVSRKKDLAALGVNVVLLASPSAVEGLLHLAEIPEDTLILSIGPSTTEAARSAGLEIAGEARRPSIEGLLEVIP